MPAETTTIAAISTPLAPGGIGVLRVSGPQARQVAAAVFAPAGGRKLAAATGHTALYGRVFDKAGEIDEAVATVFLSPRSYTGEDVVELSCHGGLYLLQRTLHALLAAGAEPAQAGEFTKRAFLNGKLSLTQAEAVMDLIAAQGQQAARAALASRDGLLFEKITQIKAGLLEIAAHLGAWVDYPEEEIPEVTTAQVDTALSGAKQRLELLLAAYDTGRVLREGVETAIVGKPNVGKSTLMNLLAGAQRSIVTELPGTTRDVVEDTVAVGGITLRLADTAGLRETSDRVELIGVALARKRLESAQLVLAVFDSSEPLSIEDLQLLQALKGRPAVAVLNKTDLPACIDRRAVAQQVTRVVEVAAATGQGAEALAQAVAEVLGVAQLDSGAAILANERQHTCAQRALTAVREGLDALHAAVTLDAVTVCLDEAIAALLELTGEQVSEAVVDSVFHNFCVGK